MARVLAVLIAGVSIMAACDSSEPSDTLLERAAKSRREEAERALHEEVRMREELHQLKVEQELREYEKRQGIKIDLPAGASAEIDVAQASLVVEVPASGAVFVAGKAVSDEDLDKVFRAAFVRDKGTQVIIRADKGVSHGRVVEIMERAKTTGLTRLAISTGK